MKQYAPLHPQINTLLHGGDYNPDQWLDRPDILQEDLRLMKLSGINCVSLGIFSWAALEPEEEVYRFEWMDSVIDSLYQNQISVILATPSGARPAWMDAKYPEVRRVNFNRVRELHGLRHNHCNTSPIYKKKVTEMNTLLAERYGHHPAVICWHVSNEYGGDCYCPLCENAFRDWLKEYYENDIEKLNHSWWSAFWSHHFNSFDEVEAPAAHGETGIHGLNLDWKRFTTWKCAQFIKTEIAPLKKIAPHLPVTTNFMGSTDGPLYDGLNYQHLTEDLDRIAWDSYPRWHTAGIPDWKTGSETSFVFDFARSLGDGKPFLLMESTPSLVNWHSVNKLKRPGVHLLSAMQAIAHGSDSVQYFQWRKSRGSGEKFHGAVVDHVENENTRTFRDVQSVSDALKKIEMVQGAGTSAKIALIYDIENRWAIQEMNGLSIYRKYEETCISHYRAFWRMGYSVDVISQEKDLSNYKVVVAPMSYLLHPGFSSKVERFVREGGTFISTYATGWVDEHDLCFLGGFPGEDLRKVLGIWEEETDALYPDDCNEMIFTGLLNGTFEVREFCSRIHPETAETLAVYGKDFYAGEPCATVNSYGNGKAYYLAARTDEEMLFKFYQAILSKSEIEGVFPGVSYPTGVTAVMREGSNGSFRFLMNFTSQPQSVALPFACCDLLSGRTDSEWTLPPYGVAVLQEVEK